MYILNIKKIIVLATFMTAKNVMCGELVVVEAFHSKLLSACHDLTVKASYEGILTRQGRQGGMFTEEAGLWRLSSSNGWVLFRLSNDAADNIGVFQYEADGDSLTFSVDDIQSFVNVTGMKPEKFFLHVASVVSFHDIEKKKMPK